MPRRATPFRQADVERVLKAARKTGLAVSGVEVAADGTIRVNLGTAGAPAEAPNPFDAWKAKRDARQAEGH